MSTSHQASRTYTGTGKYRVRPAIILVAVQWTLWLLIPSLFHGDIIVMVSIFGGMLGGLAVLIWWLFFSRVPLLCRWAGFLLMLLSVFSLTRLADPSITTAYQGMMIYAYVIPTLSLGLVAWASLGRRLPDAPRRLILIAAILVSTGVWALFRSEGISGSGQAELAWRWSKSFEERFIAGKGDHQEFTEPAVWDTGAELLWPGFRGADRNAVVPGLEIRTGWDKNPPEELWRSPVGPGCSSFAAKTDQIFTQEQREDKEAVTCYSLRTGEPVWVYSYEARFWDSHAGAGPRSTPALDTGRVYALGATGLLHALDISNGHMVWSRDAASDTKAELPGWGFAGSPLLVDEMVLVAVGGTLLAYDKQTGNIRWTGPAGGMGYSSPQLAMIDGVEQVVMLGGKGVTSFEPATGKILWEYADPEERIVQPGLTGDGRILLSTRNGTALRCLAVKHSPDGWSLNEEWISNRLKPNFNDFVIHKGYAYGFDGMSLSCVDLKDGSRMWKSGHYGGQVLILADQDMLLVLSEEGELSLVKALPDAFTEIARIPVIEGRTWNHPALAGNILLVRNSREMAAYWL
jgi:outer membrane protein assembly factor BamB